ncbi:hypothetical protein ISCGN_003511 [Ixodes scapularis]
MLCAARSLSSKSSTAHSTKAPSSNCQVCVYDSYSFQVIPVMGLLLARDWKSYQYLVESIRKFPSQEIFKDMIEAAGFKEVTFENLLGGVAAIHSGFKL